MTSRYSAAVLDECVEIWDFKAKRPSKTKIPLSYLCGCLGVPYDHQKARVVGNNIVIDSVDPSRTQTTVSISRVANLYKRRGSRSLPDCVSDTAQFGANAIGDGASWLARLIGG